MNSCNKAVYNSKKSAVKSLHLISLHKGDGRKKPVRVYFCEDCKHWHLTSKPLDVCSQSFELKYDWSNLV
jgi:uncharacterized protein YlaI